MAKLARRIIADALKKQLASKGWKIRSRVSGAIRAHAPPHLSVAKAKSEILERVNALGFEPTITGEKTTKGTVCITFSTPQTLAQAGQGGRVPTDSADKRIIAWHERILDEALLWRQDHPEFTFNLRTGDMTGQSRLARGYWFPGSNYLFFAPFKPHSPNNKTRTIGFVILFDKQGVPRRSHLGIVYGAIDPTLVPVHESIVQQLGGFTAQAGSKYKRQYNETDPLEAFHQFLERDLPQMERIIDDAAMRNRFALDQQEFTQMLERVNRLRGAGGIGPAPSGPTNLILYGPPGTGKTHWLRNKLEEYIDRPELVDEETWLQEIIGRYGWRPIIAAAMADIGREVRVPELRDHRWLKAKTVQRGRIPAKVSHTLWAYLQEHTPATVETVQYRGIREPFIFTKNEDSEWTLLEEWRDRDPEAAELYDELLNGRTASTRLVKRYRMVTFHSSYSYEDFIRGIRPVSAGGGDTTQFQIVDGVFKRICEEAHANPAKRYALFIDEISRANIAKVFGELITLIEPDKRAIFDEHGNVVQGLAVQLPGGEADAEDELFGVPPNLDIYGTMNTADRSIALLDIALRRRFDFREMNPDYRTIDVTVDGITLSKLLERINDRLELLLDREHRIGHAFMMNVTSLADVRAVFANKIIPLLQEYFFEDFQKVGMTLHTAGSEPMIGSELLKFDKLFPAGDPTQRSDDRLRSYVTPLSTWDANTFIGIYQSLP